MNTFGKISLASLGVVLFWTVFVGGLDMMGRGNSVGVVTAAIFVAILIALMMERFRAYLTAVTMTKAYPTQVFVVCALLLALFLPQAVAAANDPLTLTNVHLTRRLIYASVAAGLSGVALVVNGVALFVTRR